MLSPSVYISKARSETIVCQSHLAFKTLERFYAGREFSLLYFLRNCLLEPRRSIRLDTVRPLFLCQKIEAFRTTRRVPLEKQQHERDSKLNKIHCMTVTLHVNCAKIRATANSRQVHHECTNSTTCWSTSLPCKFAVKTRFSTITYNLLIPSLT